MKKLLLPAVMLIALTGFAATSHATTTQLSPHVWEVNSGVSFAVSNIGSTSYLFTWTDVNGTFTDIEDPSFVFTVNETYDFQRTTASHPFVLTDDTLQVIGTDGSLSRTTVLTSEIDASTLTPLADYTADPAPTSDFISWTPGPLDLGNFYYTCRVSPHTGMTGKMRIVEAVVPVTSQSFEEIKVLFR